MVIYKAICICDVCGNWLSEHEVPYETLTKDCLSLIKKKNKSLKCKITLKGRVVCAECLPSEKRAPNWSKK